MRRARQVAQKTAWLAYSEFMPSNHWFDGKQVTGSFQPTRRIAAGSFCDLISGLQLHSTDMLLSCRRRYAHCEQNPDQTRHSCTARVQITLPMHYNGAHRTGQHQ